LELSHHDPATTRPQRLTSVENAAHYADVSERSIRRWISQGLITGYRVGPRLVKVDLDDLDNLAVPIPTAGGGPNAAA
jgi:excisionase family DNA binding protein